ncbi:SART-1 family [Euphorbia peplus]|nr:SART-1 family [Euphorbia peplus]
MRKTIRKKENAVDLDALEVEAVGAGLGAGDVGWRSDGRRRQAIRDEQERAEAETTSNTHQTALAKAYAPSKSLQPLSSIPVFHQDETPDQLFKSLQRPTKLAFHKETYGPQAVARLAMAITNNQHESIDGDSEEENKLVFTETDEFVRGLQLDEEPHKTDSDDVFRIKVNDTCNADKLVNESKGDVVLDAITREVPVGKGLSGALELLKKRGSLNEGPEWGGRNMDKKKSKLVGCHDGNIRTKRLDEFGRTMTPKEEFRKFSHRFHGKGPSKGKQEKRRKQYLEERKLKQMNSSSSVERMRETLAQLKTPYLVLSTGRV